MKKFNLNKMLLVGVFALFVFQPFVFAVNSPTGNFKYSRPILPSATSEYVKLALDKDIYNNMVSYPNDLRIFDSKSREVPYFNSLDYNNGGDTFIPLIISNKGTINGDISLDISLYNISKPISNMHFDMTSQNGNGSSNQPSVKGGTNSGYILQPTIKGSDDKKNWVEIKTNSFLYRISSNNNQFSNTIEFEPLNFKYIKLNLKVLSGNITPSDIYSISSRLSSQQDSRIQQNKESKIIESKQEGDVNILVIDNKYANAPISRVNFNVVDRDFSRQVALFGSHDQKKWTLIVPSEEIYSLKIQKTDISKTYLDIPASQYKQNINYRYIKAHFLKKQDSPLKMDSIDVLYYQDFVIFDCIANERYTAYFGNSKVTYLQYNTEKLKQFVNISTLKQINWEVAAANNSLYSGANNSDPEKSKYPLTIFILFMVIVLGWFIFKSLKSIKQTSENKINDDTKESGEG